MGIALGCEDLNDHDLLRHDPAMAVVAGKLAAKRSDCAPVAGKSTLNRLELGGPEPSRWHRITHDGAAIEALPVTLFMEAHRAPPDRIVLGRWPGLQVLLRADTGFARDPLMAWCEANGVDYLFGLAKNRRLAREVETELAHARAHSVRTGKPQRRFRDFMWRTHDSWSRPRRVVAKAEFTHGKANPRFVVTSLTAGETRARRLYERLYCRRGEMETRIKECQRDLFADRTSSHTMRANQLRLWFASMAYVLMGALRRIGLAHTRLAVATCATLRLKLLKVAAWVRVSVRRVKIAMASTHPCQNEFRIAHAR